MTYPADNLPTLRCWRCGEPADVEWCNIQTISEPGPVHIPGYMTCPTPGCVDENGSNATSDTPPSPQEIQRRADAVVARFYAA